MRLYLLCRSITFITLRVLVGIIQSALDQYTNDLAASMQGLMSSKDQPQT